VGEQNNKRATHILPPHYLKSEIRRKKEEEDFGLRISDFGNLEIRFI